jgi:hypothetical protein
LSGIEVIEDNNDTNINVTTVFEEKIIEENIEIEKTDFSNSYSEVEVLENHEDTDQGLIHSYDNNLEDIPNIKEEKNEVIDENDNFYLTENEIKDLISK